MLWLSRSYINQLSGSLRNFKWKNPRLANFSCPICGDSKTDDRKARGYLFVSTDKKTFQEDFTFKCHNGCPASGFEWFLKTINPALHEQYKLEKLKEKYTQNGNQKSNVVIPQPIYVPRRTFKANHKAVPLTSLPATHPARMYLANRGVPYDRVYWTDDFKTLIEDFAPDKYEHLHNDGRICFLFKKHGDEIPFAIAGRSLDPDSEMRYITCRFDEDSPKLYGLDKHDREKPTIVVEGPIDSLLLPNAIAMAGGSLSFEVLDQYVDRSKTYVCLDNEPRNKFTVAAMLKFAERGYKVMVWKSISSDFKDVNDMLVKAGMSRRSLLSLIVKDSVSGLKAQHEINAWKKCTTT